MVVNAKKSKKPKKGAKLEPTEPDVTAKHKNITRLQGAGRRAQGWWVRVYRTVDDKQKCYSKLFSDSHYQGSDVTALTAAIAWRQQTLKACPAPATGGRREAPKPPGYGTVRRVQSSYRPRPVNGKAQERKFYYAWVVWIRIEDGRSAGTKWSITRWGEQGAYERAMKWCKQVRKDLKARLNIKRLPSMSIEPVSKGPEDVVHIKAGVSYCGDVAELTPRKVNERKAS